MNSKDRSPEQTNDREQATATQSPREYPSSIGQRWRESFPERFGSFETTDQTVVYDRENADAWIASDQGQTLCRNGEDTATDSETAD